MHWLEIAFETVRVHCEGFRCRSFYARFILETVGRLSSAEIGPCFITLRERTIIILTLILIILIFIILILNVFIVMKVTGNGLLGRSRKQFTRWNDTLINITILLLSRLRPALYTYFRWGSLSVSLGRKWIAGICCILCRVQHE